MATSAPTTDLERVQAERTRAAWEHYRDSLRDLSGRDYDDAERACWDELRRELRAIERDLAAPAPG
jgi:DNA-binding GntR family transcriptional regulator